MRRYWKIILMTVGAVIAVAWLSHRIRRPEPEYAGKPVSTWVDQFAAYQDDCRTAIRERGANGLRFAVKRLEQNDSVWSKHSAGLYSKLPAILRNAVPRPKPMLRVVDGANWFYLVGSNSIPYASPFLKHHSPTVRQAAAWGFGSLRRETAAADQAIPHRASFTLHFSLFLVPQ